LTYHYQITFYLCCFQLIHKHEAIATPTEEVVAEEAAVEPTEKVADEETQGKEKTIDSVSTREVPDEATTDFMDKNFYRDNLAGFAGSGEKQETN